MGQPYEPGRRSDNADGNSDADTDTRGYADTDAYGDAHSDTYGYANPDGDTDTNADCNTDARTDANTHINGNTRPDSNTDTHTEPRHLHPDADCDRGLPRQPQRLPGHFRRTQLGDGRPQHQQSRVAGLYFGYRAERQPDDPAIHDRNVQSCSGDLYDPESRSAGRLHAACFVANECGLDQGTVHGRTGSDANSDSYCNTDSESNA